MKKIALISTFCNNEEKQKILEKNILKMKSLGLDVMVISPIEIPENIINKADYFFFTKENPILKWPVRIYTHWYEMRLSENRITTLQRGLGDYGWAGLYQVKKLSQIALTFDYELFYHMIYDVVIDQEVESDILSNKCNLVYPRRDPHHPETLWETTLHLMIFDREMMKKIESEITLDEYLSTNGMAEGEVLKWKNKYNIPTSEHPVKDEIFYWGDFDFFDYSPFPEFKMFLSKNEKMKIWLGENPIYETELTDNLRICFHSFPENEEIKIVVNDQEYYYKPKNWEYLEFPVSSQKIEKLILKYRDRIVDFTKQYDDIMMNQIYYNHRP